MYRIKLKCWINVLIAIYSAHQKKRYYQKIIRDFPVCPRQIWFILKSFKKCHFIKKYKKMKNNKIINSQIKYIDLTKKGEKLARDFLTKKDDHIYYVDDKGNWYLNEK